MLYSVPNNAVCRLYCKIHFVPLVITAADKIMYLEQFSYKISDGWTHLG